MVSGVALPALAVRAVSKCFGANRVLDRLSLEISPGEVVALMGANGAGKSTLVKILSGALELDEGTIEIGGKPARLRSPAAAKAAGIVAVHQQVAASGVPGLSAAENLLLDAICGGAAEGDRLSLLLTPHQVMRRATELAAATQLTLDLAKPFGALSLADRQLITIARALAGRPRLLILDEPTASLAAPEAEQLFTLIDRMKAHGVAVLFISHRLADLRRVADRAVVLRNGRLAGSFSRPLDLAAATTAMIGRTVAAIPGAPRPEPGSRFLSLAGVRLRPGAPSIDLELAAGEIAALAELRTRLLLPENSAAWQQAREEAAALREQLVERARMLIAFDWLDARAQLGRDVFGCGAPTISTTRSRTTDLTALLRACLAALQAEVAKGERYRPRPPAIWPVQEAHARVQALLPTLSDIVPDEASLWQFLPDAECLASAGLAPDTVPDPVLLCRSAVASTLVAGLELARQGKITLAQDGGLGAINVRTAQDEPVSESVD